MMNQCEWLFSMLKKNMQYSSPTRLEVSQIYMAMRQYDMNSEMRKKTRRFHSFKKFFYCYFHSFVVGFLIDFY